MFLDSQDPERKREFVNAMNDVVKVLNEMKKNPDEQNEFVVSFADRPDDFLASLCKKGRERFAAVSIIMVCLVITSASVNATKEPVRGKKPWNTNHVFSITRKAVANSNGSR